MANAYDLAHKTAIVTGGAKSIGKAVADLFLRSGARVIVWDLNRAHVEGALCQVVDITETRSIDAALAELPIEGRIDILVNGAGYLGRTTSFTDHRDDDWRRIVDTNLVGTMQLTKAVLPRMIRQQSGRIVNFGSLAGKEGLPGLAAYSAASGGLIAFTKALSREVVKHNVLVNCIAPGPIDTDMIRHLGAEVVQRMIADSPMTRLGRVEEVAELVAWLCSEASQFNTGAVFDMSGGRARY